MMQNYIKAAGKLHTDRDLPSPHGTPKDYTTIVLEAVLKYEKGSDRRNMIDNEMIHCIVLRC